MLMSRKRVIVKRLNSIQNLGAMDVLCTDKTGTLTMDKVILERYCDVVRKEDSDVLSFAFLNSYFQTGLKNLMDRAILDHQEVRAKLNLPEHEKVDEIPFDFSRKVMSVVVKDASGKHRLICKGAPEEVFKRCKCFELEGEVLPIERVLLQDLREEYDDLSTHGFRVLALAYKDVEPRASYSKDDECNLTLKGYLAFLDPPKDSAAPAIKALQEHGIAVKVLTGDNDLVSRTICRQVGLPVDKVLLGGDVEKMSDEGLADAVNDVTLFARLSPAHKQRIIKALQSKQHVVGFLGDGINDAPALRAADVGISVDTAVDIAKESADAILLEKSLLVLEEGVLEGRKVFANILKYIRMGASSNFGNMFSVVGASIWLPFLPMQAIQILTNNLLYDFSQVPIPTDHVDPEQIAKPRPWSMGQITRFILFIGPCSSVFDYTTFLIMWFVFMCGSPKLTCPPHYLQQATEWAGRQDLRKPPGWFTEASKDGKVTRDQWLEAGQSEDKFDELDKDHRGYLTDEEVAKDKEVGEPDPDQGYRAMLFQTAWLVESLLTQTLIIHIIRTNRIPFLQSWSSGALACTSLAIMMIGMWLPFIPFMRETLGLVMLPPAYWPLLLLTLFCYVVLTQLVKTWLLKRGWIEETTTGRGTAVQA
jgi:magnesium-translocating P-type ATPase